MKKILLTLGLMGLLAGCASHDNMGGSSDGSFHSNATWGTGSSTAGNEGHIIYGSPEWTNSTPKGGPY
jgi:hypothetical protein